MQASANMLRAMNESADPCDDFYQYACGGWVAANPIPDGKSMWGTFTKLEQQNQQILKTALGKVQVPHSSSSAREGYPHLSIMLAVLL